MKPILLFLCCSFSLTALTQRSTLLSRLSMNTATAEQRGKFKDAFGLGTGFEWAIKKGSPLKLAVNTDISLNGMTSRPYEFLYRNTLTQTNINYSSHAVQFATGLRYVFNESKSVRPYAGMGMGVFIMGTSYSIEDPKNPNGCHALESKNIQSDQSFIGRWETGLRFTTGRNKLSSQRIFFDVGVSYLRGTSASYMRLSSADQTAEGAAYYVKFKTLSNEEHEHAIGTTYRTAVSQLMFHVGVGLPLLFTDSKCTMRQKCSRR